jgi:uncharacterized GH25 family protein
MTTETKSDRSPDPLTLATTALRETSAEAAFSDEWIARAEQIPVTASDRRIDRLPRKLLAASLAFLLVGLAAWFFLQRSAAIAFADVAHAINQTQTFTGIIESMPGGIRVSVKGPKARVESADFIFIVDQSSGDVLHLATATHQARKAHLPQYQYDLYAMLRDYQTGKEKKIGEKEIRGRKTVGFQLKRAFTLGDGEQTWTFWIDPATKLPVQVEVLPAVITDLKFDVPLADALFEMKVPPDYALAPPSTKPDASAQFKYAGQVVDERGKPLANVEVQATRRYPSGGMGYLGDGAKTDKNGRFSIIGDNGEIFIVDRTGTSRTLNVARNVPVRIEFRDRDRLYAKIEDVQVLPPEQRGDLHVKLLDGEKVSGRVVDSAGKPVAGAMVQTIFGRKNRADDFEIREAYRKAAVTDAAGKFELRGLPPAVADLQVRRMDGAGPILVGRLEIDLRDATKIGAAEVIAQAFVLPPGKVVHELFGMKLIDADEELRDLLFLYDSDRVMILDPGADSQRLDIGNLQRGDAFWMAGEVRIEDFNEFARTILELCEEQKRKGSSRLSARVVYNFDRPDSSGSNTQMMALTDADLVELRAAVKGQK